MHPLVMSMVLTARHDDLLREAERQRRAAQARRHRDQRWWHERSGTWFVGIGEALKDVYSSGRPAQRTAAKGTR